MSLQVLQNTWLSRYGAICGWGPSAGRTAVSFGSRQRVSPGVCHDLETQVLPYVSPLPFQPDGTFPYHEAPESTA